MKINWYVIGYALLIVIIVFQCNNNKTDNRVEEVKKEAKVKIDGYRKENDSLKKEIRANKKIEDSLQGVIDNSEKRSQQLKKETDEKIDRISHYTVSELQQYFTDNYPE